MSKLLFIPLDWHKKTAQIDFYNGLQTQFDCTYYSGANSDLMRNKPDIILIMSGAISLEELGALKKLTGATIAQWTGDARPEPLEIVTRHKSVVDKTFLACGLGQQKEYEKLLGHPVFWLQHAGTMFVEPNEMQTGGIAFVGNYYDQFEGGAERNKLCYDLDVLYDEDFFCYGSWGDSRGQCAYDDTPWIYNNAYISISANIFNDIEGYWSNRPYDILAAGSCCMMRYVPSIEKHFTDMEHCVYYRSNGEALDKIKWLLDNPDERNRIAKAGFEHCKANHTYLNRARELWDLL